jgi:hypothetical protein
MYTFKFTAESNSLYGRILAIVYDKDNNPIETFEACSPIGNIWKPMRDRLISIFGIEITHVYYHHMLTDFLRFYGKYCSEDKCMEIAMLENIKLMEQDLRKLDLVPKMVFKRFKCNKFLLQCVYNSLTAMDKSASLLS